MQTACREKRTSRIRPNHLNKRPTEAWRRRLTLPIAYVLPAGAGDGNRCLALSPVISTTRLQDLHMQNRNRTKSNTFLLKGLCSTHHAEETNAIGTSMTFQCALVSPQDHDVNSNSLFPTARVRRIAFIPESSHPRLGWSAMGQIGKPDRSSAIRRRVGPSG